MILISHLQLCTKCKYSQKSLISRYFTAYVPGGGLHFHALLYRCKVVYVFHSHVNFNFQLLKSTPLPPSQQLYFHPNHFQKFSDYIFQFLRPCVRKNPLNSRKIQFSSIQKIINFPTSTPL